MAPWPPPTARHAVRPPSGRTPLPPPPQRIPNLSPRLSSPLQLGCRLGLGLAELGRPPAVPASVGGQGGRQGAKIQPRPSLGSRCPDVGLVPATAPNVLPPQREGLQGLFQLESPRGPAHPPSANRASQQGTVAVLPSRKKQAGTGEASSPRWDGGTVPASTPSPGLTQTPAAGVAPDPSGLPTQGATDSTQRGPTQVPASKPRKFWFLLADPHLCQLISGHPTLNGS